MTLDLDTFLVALYTLTDDLYRQFGAPYKPSRPGRRPQLSDSEVLTLAICAQWYPGSERAFIRYAVCHWRSYFPRLLSQSAYNRRSRDLAGVLVHLVPQVAKAMGAYTAAYQALDTVQVPLMRRCRGQHHHLFADEAAIGRGGSDHDWYYGCKLLISVSPEGAVTGFVLAPANTEDHWVMEAFLCWRANPKASPCTPEAIPKAHRRGPRNGYVGPTGPLWPRNGPGQISLVPYIADDGFRGRWWRSHWHEDYGAIVLTPSLYLGEQAPIAKRQQAGWRQVVETVNEHLTHVFGLAFPGARTTWGLLTRVAAKLLASNLGLWLNRLTGRPGFAFATLFSF